MSKITKSFTFTAPIVSKYGKDKKTYGYATIAGFGYWQSTNDEWDGDYADFDIETLTIKVGDKEESAIAAYHLSQLMKSDFEDDINALVLAHLEHVFFPNGKLISAPCTT